MTTNKKRSPSCTHAGECQWVCVPKVFNKRLQKWIFPKNGPLLCWCVRRHEV